MPLQLGGLPKQPVTAASHVARLFLAHRTCRPCFLLVLDLKKAFYRVARPLLVDFHLTEERTAQLFAALGIPASAYHDFVDALTGRKALEVAGASPWLRSVLREFLSNTWFRMRDQPDVVSTTLGTRPGDGLADVLFYFLFARVLHKVVDLLKAKGIRVELPWHPDMRG